MSNLSAYKSTPKFSKTLFPIMSINRQDKPYSKETLIRYYQEIKREEFERLNDTMITERFLTLINLLQKQS